MRLGIIGYGNIGEMLVKNIVNLGSDYFNELYISNRNIEKIKHLNSISDYICTTDSNIDLAKNCDKIIICVETPNLLDVFNEINPYIGENTHIIHCSAGISRDDLLNVVDKPITCVIPTISSTYDGKNYPKGISIFFHDECVLNEDKKYIEGLFSKFSIVKNVYNENDLKILLIATSCMPAFISLVVNQMSSEFSKKSNFKIEDFRNFLSETLISTALLLKNDIYNCDDLIRKVATKGGITQKGIDYLNSNLIDIEIELINRLM